MYLWKIYLFVMNKEFSIAQQESARVIQKYLAQFGAELIDSAEYEFRGKSESGGITGSI